jgi:hypothetical protein
MSELAGILAFAVLFILFCALPLRRASDACLACRAEEDEARASCSGCPYATERPVPMEERGRR